jgi:hypothetical protein
MATPREQHAARPGARVVGSGHLDGREPVAEGGTAGADAARPAAGGQDPQRALDAAASEPRSDAADAATDATADGADVHPAPARQRPHPDNTDVRG